MADLLAIEYTMAKRKTEFKKTDCSPFEERILRWSEQVKPGPPAIRASTRERRPPDRYIPAPFLGTRPVMSSQMPPPPSLKRPQPHGGSVVTRSSASKRSKTDTVVTQVKDLMTFSPAMYGRNPKDFLECIRQEAVLLHEFEQLKAILRLHVSRSTMKDNGLIPSKCKELIASSKTLQRVSYDFPPEPQVYGTEWPEVDDPGVMVMVQTVERIMENTQRYNAQSPEDSWCGQIVQPILDLMQDLHSGSVLSVIAQNEVITPQELCPRDQNERIPQSGKKKVDHVLGLQISEEQEAKIRQHAGFSKSVNQSVANSLSSTPIFLDVEVKTVNKNDPLVQLRIWEAAGHNKRELESWSTEMPMLGIVVDGHTWNLQIGFWSPRDKRLIFGASYHIGSTDDIVSIFHIISNLHKICIWANDHYRKWFERQLDNYDKMSEAQFLRGTATKGKNIAIGSDDAIDEGDSDDEDEARLSENPGSQQSRPRQSTRKPTGAESRLSPALGELQVGNPLSADPLYELKLVALYEHSRRRGHKTCAYRGCHADETLEGDVHAFAQSGEPRKFFKWLHKRAERELRKEAVRMAIPEVAEGKGEGAANIAEEDMGLEI